jgi:hypothetical protein
VSDVILVHLADLHFGRDVDLTQVGDQMATSANTLHVALAIPEDEAERMVTGTPSVPDERSTTA